MGQSMGRGLDALLNRNADNKKRVDTLKLYRDSALDAMSDGVFTSDEKKMLKNLAGNLGISEEEQIVIIQEVLDQTGAVEKEGKGGSESEAKALKIERDALAHEIKLMKQDEGIMMKQISEMQEKIVERNKKINALTAENEQLKKKLGQ